MLACASSASTAPTYNVISLDTLDVTLDTSPLPTVHRDRLIHRQTTDPETGEVHDGWYTLKGSTGLHGFSGLASTPFSVSLRLSAKAMGNRYSEGISLGTLGELCDRITGTGLVSLTPDDLLNAVVRRADPFADVVGTGDVGAALRLVGRTLGEGTETKGRAPNVTLYHKLPQAAGRLRAYAKGPELAKAEHKGFRALYPEAVAYVDGRTRFEVEAKTYDATRRIAWMDKGNPRLRDVLRSDRQPVADALDAMLDTWTGARRALHPFRSIPDGIPAFLAMPPASFSDDAVRFLAAWLADCTAGDFNVCKEVVRGRYGVNASRYYPALRSACEAYAVDADADSLPAAVASLRACSAEVRQREAA